MRTMPVRHIDALLGGVAGRVERYRRSIYDLCAADLTPATLVEVRRLLQLIDGEHRHADRLLDQRHT